MSPAGFAGSAELPGMTSRWVGDEAGAASLGLLAGTLGHASFITVVTAQDADGRLVGACCDAPPVLSDSGAPAFVWTLPTEAQGLHVFTHATHVALNFLAMTGGERGAGDSVARHFAAQRNDKFASLAFEFGLGGAPLLERATATFECENRPHGTLDPQGRWVFTGLVRRYRQAGVAMPARN